MPAVSKNQQRAAAIALSAKRGGKVDSLRAGSAKEMAKSMSEDELEKFASTKRKGLPRKKPKKESWAGSSLEEVFSEEMIGVSTEDTEAEDHIAPQKSKDERIDDKDIKSGKRTSDTWTSASGGKQPSLASHPRGSMSGNTMGTRVAESIDLARWSKMAGLVTEQVELAPEDEDYEECHMCGGRVDPEMGECEECGFQNPSDPIRVPRRIRQEPKLEPGNIAASQEDMFESALHNMDDSDLLSED